MARFRVCVTVDYDADPAYYEDRSVPEMARIDQELFEEDPAALLEMIQDSGNYNVFMEILDGD